MAAKPNLAYNSVLTTIRILETKGYVKHLKDKRAHVYIPKIDRKDATRSEVRHLVSRFFGNSHQHLVLNILEESSIDADELARVRQLLESSGNSLCRVVLGACFDRRFALDRAGLVPSGPSQYDWPAHRHCAPEFLGTLPSGCVGCDLSLVRYRCVQSVVAPQYSSPQFRRAGYGGT